MYTDVLKKTALQYGPNSPEVIGGTNPQHNCFAQDKYDLSIVYTDVLKKTALQYGPNSPEVMRALIDLDDVFQVIFLLWIQIENKENVS